jgi:hypothetical protein
MTVNARLGIIGVPEDAREVLALCAQLVVDPVFLVDGDRAPILPAGCEVVPLRDRSSEGLCDAAQLAQLTGLWAVRCEDAPRLAEAAKALDMHHMPCLDEARQSTLPIEGAIVYPFSALEKLREKELHALPIPAWVRATSTRGDRSCMRLEHPNDLSLAAAKLQRRNSCGLVRVQPVVEGPVYRMLAFKTGTTLAVACVLAEEMTSSVYRVPLGMSLPVGGDAAMEEGALAIADQANSLLPAGWGYVELEFVDTGHGLKLIDVQCATALDPHVRQLVRLALGIDLYEAAMACALGRVPDLSPTAAGGAAMTWLLTRSGIVTGFQGVEEARRMPGIFELLIIAREGDILSHVVDVPSRERGGYIIATGDSAAQARERLEAARARVWINTSPALA